MSILLLAHSVPVRTTKLPYPVKDLERLSDLVLGVLLVDLHGHHGEELGEVNGPGPVLVDLVHHVLSEDIFVRVIFCCCSVTKHFGSQNCSFTFFFTHSVFVSTSQPLDHLLTCSSASVGFCPICLSTAPSSFELMTPSRSVSNRQNASYGIENVPSLSRFFTGKNIEDLGCIDEVLL